MKKVLSMILALIMCLSLCACGGTKLTAAEVNEALANCDGILNLETSGNNVTGFTYVVEGVNAEYLVDKEYTREAIEAVLTGDTSQITFGQIKVCKAIAPLMSIEALLSGVDDNFSSNAFIKKILSITCDGKTVEYDGWAVSVEVDHDNDSIIIKVVSK